MRELDDGTGGEKHEDAVEEHGVQGCLTRLHRVDLEQTEGAHPDLQAALHHAEHQVDRKAGVEARGEHKQALIFQVYQPLVEEGGDWVAGVVRPQHDVQQDVQDPQHGGQTEEHTHEEFCYGNNRIFPAVLHRDL